MLLCVVFNLFLQFATSIFSPSVTDCIQKKMYGPALQRSGQPRTDKINGDFISRYVHICYENTAVHEKKEPLSCHLCGLAFAKSEW